MAFFSLFLFRQLHRDRSFQLALIRYPLCALLLRNQKTTKQQRQQQASLFSLFPLGLAASSATLDFVFFFPLASSITPGRVSECTSLAFFAQRQATYTTYTQATLEQHTHTTSSLLLFLIFSRFAFFFFFLGSKIRGLQQCTTLGQSRDRKPPGFSIPPIVFSLLFYTLSFRPLYI